MRRVVETLPNRSEFNRLVSHARMHGWRIPDPDQDSHGPAVWMRYWAALEEKERDPSAGRPVVPHTPGQRGPEDHLQRAERINRNRALWRGYL